MMAASLASAQTNQTDRPSGLTLETGADRPLNRFGLSYRAGFNITAKFKNLAGFTQMNNPGPATRRTNHNYDDGYNRVDSANNSLGLTWNWGYENASQVPGDGFIHMHSISSAQQSASKERDDDPQHGLEVTYNRQLGRVGQCFWGLEGAFNFTDVTFRDGQKSGRTVSLTTDRYDLTSPPPPVIPPEAPYHGTFEGPGPAISDLPVRTVSAATASGSSKIEASIYGFRVGPYLDVPLSEKFGLSFSGGLAIGILDSTFDFEESVVSPSTGVAVARSGSDSEDDVLFGAYVGANISYAITESINVFAGVQYQYLDSYSHRVSDKKADVDLGKSIFLTVGFGYSF